MSKLDSYEWNRKWLNISATDQYSALMPDRMWEGIDPNPNLILIGEPGIGRSSEDADG